MRRGQANKSKARPSVPVRRLADGTGAPPWCGSTGRGEGPPLTGGKCGAHSPEMCCRETLTWGVGWPVFQKLSRPFFARSSQGYPHATLCCPHSPVRCRLLVSPGQARSPLLSLAHSVWRGKRQGVEEGCRTGHGLRERGGRRPVLWPSRTSASAEGWSFTRRMTSLLEPCPFCTRVSCSSASSLFTRTFWGTAWFLEWLSLVCERSCMCLNGVNSCCTYVWGEMAWLAAGVAWWGTSFSWGAPSTGSCKVLQRKQFWLKEMTEKVFQRSNC